MRFPVLASGLFDPAPALWETLKPLHKPAVQTARGDGGLLSSRRRVPGPTTLDHLAQWSSVVGDIALARAVVPSRCCRPRLRCRRKFHAACPIASPTLGICRCWPLFGLPFELGCPPGAETRPLVLAGCRSVPHPAQLLQARPDRRPRGWGLIAAGARRRGWPTLRRCAEVPPVVWPGPAPLVRIAGFRSRPGLRLGCAGGWHPRSRRKTLHIRYGSPFRPSHRGRLQFRQ